MWWLHSHVSLLHFCMLRRQNWHYGQKKVGGCGVGGAGRGGQRWWWSGGGNGGHFKSNMYFFSPHISFYLKAFLSSLSFYPSLASLSLTWLLPFNDLQDTYCVFSFRLNFIGKKHTSEHRFNARTRVWNTPLKSSCTRLLKFTRKTRHSNTETLAHERACVWARVSVRRHT